MPLDGLPNAAGQAAPLTEQIEPRSNLTPKKSRGRNKSTIKLVEAMKKIAEESRPITGRGVGYKLFTAGLIENMNQMNVVYRALKLAREDGIIPWDWIVDETRSLDDYIGSVTIRDAVLERLSVLRLDPWGDDRPPMVLTESRSLAGVLRNLVWDYAARIASTKGQCGGFLRTVIAPQLREGDRVLYFGDWDRAGGHIEANTRRVLEKIVGKLRWERLALTEAQVTHYDLPIIEKSDSRYKDGRGRHQAVETEALSQTIILEILRDKLDLLLLEPLEVVHERAEAERAAIERLLHR
jgi:hypothetical protein